MPRFEHEGISHYYTVSGVGYPIILVHGMGLSHQMWIGQLPIFARYYTMISYDCRGHGGTGSSKGPIEIRNLSEDLRMLMDELNIEKAVLVGYSTGTLICESFALDHPDRVAAMCLIGAYAKVSGVYMTLKSNMSKWMIHANLNKFVAYDVARSNAENLVQRGFFYRIAKRVDPEESLRLLAASQRFVSTRKVATIKCPVLLVHGSRDRSTEAYARDFVAQMPDAEIAVVEKCNHAVATRAMSAFNLLLDQWLGKLELPTASRLPEKSMVE